MRKEQMLVGKTALNLKKNYPIETIAEYDEEI